MVLQNTQQFVIVDDTNPRIIYSPAKHWTLLNVNISDPTDFVVPPQYGTLHRAEFENANFTFTFTGVSIVAVFYGSDTGAISSCTLDGQPMQVDLAGIRQTSILCSNNQTIPNGSHELIVKVNSNIAATLLFDYIKYAPNEGNITATDEDIEYSFIESFSYFANNTLVMNETVTDPLSTGNTVDFLFVGYSLGLYASFFAKVTGDPCPVSYSIDGNPPLNFTISNPTTNITTEISSIIVLQSPRYSLGQHHFHLEVFEDDTTVYLPLNLDYIIIQNITTPHVLLDPLPIVSSPDPPSSATGPLSTAGSAPSPHINPSSSHIGAMIGGTAAGVIMLALIIVLVFLARRRLSPSLDDKDVVHHANLFVEPFQDQHDPPLSRSRKSRTNQTHGYSNVLATQNEESNLFIEPFHQWHTRFRSFRKNLAHRRRVAPIVGVTRNADPTIVLPTAHRRHNDSNVSETQNVEPNLVTAMESQRPLRYRIHEDSGEEITQPDEGTVIVDLPPTYTTIGFTTPHALPQNEPTETDSNEDRVDRDVDAVERPHVTKV